MPPVPCAGPPDYPQLWNRAIHRFSRPVRDAARTWTHRSPWRRPPVGSCAPWPSTWEISAGRRSHPGGSWLKSVRVLRHAVNLPRAGVLECGVAQRGTAFELVPPLETPQMGPPARRNQTLGATKSKPRPPACHPASSMETAPPRPPKRCRVLLSPHAKTWELAARPYPSPPSGPKPAVSPIPPRAVSHRQACVGRKKVVFFGPTPRRRIQLAVAADLG